MRIAVLSNAYPPKMQGGAGNIAFEYSKALEQSGHEVKVFGPDEIFHLLSRLPPLARLSFHLHDLKPRKKIVDEILAWKPDVLISHNLTGCGFGTPRAVQKSGVRWLHVLHDVQLFEPSGQIIYAEKFVFMRKIWRSFWASLRRKSLGAPDVVISPTKWLMQEHKKFGFFKQTKNQILPNPVEPAVESVNSARDSRKILYVGRLDSDKGIDVLLAAWPRIKEATSSWVVIGAGQRLDYLHSLNDPKIEARGAMPRDKVLEEMQRCGVLVLPSLVMENQPTVILEALANGCKVVAADVGGVRETLGSAGWIFTPGSAQEFSKSILQALQDTDAKREMAASEILRLHDPKVFVSCLAGLLKSNL